MATHDAPNQQSVQCLHTVYQAGSLVQSSNAAERLCLDSSQLPLRQRLRAVQDVISSLKYNHTKEQYFNVSKACAQISSSPFILFCSR